MQYFVQSSTNVVLAPKTFPTISWNSMDGQALRGLKTKRKREHENIKDVIRRIGPAVKEQREEIRKEL